MCLIGTKFETEFSLTTYLDYYIYSKNNKQRHKNKQTKSPYYSLATTLKYKCPPKLFLA